MSQAFPTLDRNTVGEALRNRMGRNIRGRIIALVMALCAVFCVIITIGIVFVLMETTVQFFTNELFTNIGLLQETARQLGQEQGLSGAALNDVVRLAIDDRERTIEKVAEALGGGVSVEQFQTAFEQLKESATDGTKFWITLKTSISRFFFDNRWTPLFASKRFGIWPLVNGTALVTVVAMLVATPLGLATAIFLGMYAPRNIVMFLRPMVELLAGVPTVVYGYFALIYVTPVIRAVVPDTAIFNASSAGILMGLMILPTVGSISLDAITSVPKALRDGAYGLGATKMETIIKVILPAAASGIISAIILGISRAVGETMIVTIAAGQQPISYVGNPAEVLGTIVNPFQTIATMTAYIAQVSLGDAPYGSVEYETLFAVGMVLFVITLSTNIISKVIASRIREDYV
ncbi:MAG: phosphate ABC transporter permease subunit PstC [Cyanobacteria bacterium J06642_2]